MNDEAQIRRANLRHLCKSRSWSVRELADRLPFARYSYWRDLLADGSTKSFGEKVARRIEEALELTRGWLDEPVAGPARPYSTARQAAPPKKPPDDFSDRHEVSASDWALLQDIKTGATPEEIATIRARAAMVEQLVNERLAAVVDGARPATEVASKPKPTPRT